jgi:anaerobic magnesium-protoporphyrin IX monomethyl ester cyclase
MRTLLTTLHSKYIHASLALPCLAAYCGEECGEIVIGEYSVNEPKEIVLAQLVGWDADVICFSVYLWNRIATLELVSCLKLIKPEQKIVLGGPEISFEADDFSSLHPVDALICGEGENPLRHLLLAWQQGIVPQPIGGLRLPDGSADPGRSLLESLDDIPSPFAAGLVDLSKGLIYYESSRGCPYTCSFCMSALDDQVRSFSMERIKADLKILMDNKVGKIKFVDRTFNYNNQRSREIFNYILENNQSSHFHFEIGAHLLDHATLELLEQVPDGMFQFEIGVQSTLPETLQYINRNVSLEQLSDNILYLKYKTNIHIHLDLIAGLPGETYPQFLKSIDRVISLGADHLQIEPVKLLPGAPLRNQADKWGIHYDPNPPYTVLASADLNFADLERLRGIGLLLDLLVNSGRFRFLLPCLTDHFVQLSLFLEDLDKYWREKNLYPQRRSLRDLYLVIDDYLLLRFRGGKLEQLREYLSRDYAHHERVVGGSAPGFFNTDLSDQQQDAVRGRVKKEVAEMDRSGKVQYFAALFDHLQGASGRTILIFLYHKKSSAALQVKELCL